MEVNSKSFMKRGISKEKQFSVMIKRKGLESNRLRFKCLTVCDFIRYRQG